MIKLISIVTIIGILLVGAPQKLISSPTKRIDSLVQVKPISMAKVPSDFRKFPFVMLEMEFNSSKFIKDIKHLLQDDPSKVE